MSDYSNQNGLPSSDENRDKSGIENVGFESEEPQKTPSSEDPSKSTDPDQFKIQTTLTPEEKKRECRRISKNIWLVSAAFLFNFQAFQGLSRLQSSLHQDEGMGVINSSVLYASLVLSCLFLPKIAITKIGHKWCIVVSFTAYILWMGANGIGRWWSMTPTSILVGLAAAPLWTAQCSYFTKLAVRYAELTDEKQQDIVTKFFGIFFMFFQTCK